MAIVYNSKESDISKYFRNSNLDDNHLFIIGGDGTYLRALSNFNENEVPDVYAFNDGKVGFLLPLKKDNYKSISDRIRNKELKYIIRTRTKLTSHNRLFCNEVVIRSNKFQLNTFKIKIDDFLFEIQASEIVIATSAGSTGYSLSLGGPINLTDSLILNCTAPNRFFFTPIILPTSSHISIESEGCKAWVDGIEYDGLIFTFSKGDSYKVYIEDDYNLISGISQIIKSLKS